MQRTKRVLGWLVAGMVVLARGWGAELRVAVAAEAPGALIGEDFCGLSFESKLLLPDADGRRYFDAGNAALVAVFRQLGIRSLRIGGNTAERASVAIPDEADIDSLFGFARAAGVKVIYTVRMDGNTPDEAARIAAYVAERHGDLLECFIIGNEPNKGRSYEAYYAKWSAFAERIRAADAVPEARFCAPTATDSGPFFAALMAKDEEATGRLAMIGQHFYAGGGSKGADGIPEAALAGMMALGWHERYQEFHDSFVPSVLAAGHRFRINETNSFSSGGVLGASDTFAATVWGLDYLYWWAGHSASGINFHSGEKVYPGDPVVRKNVYTPLTRTAGGVKVLPLGYAVKAFTLAAHGRWLVPVTLEAAEGTTSVAAYAVRDGQDGTIWLTLLNGEYGTYGKGYQVLLELPAGTRRIRQMDLTVEGGAVAAADGVKLGNSTIDERGAWDGGWAELELAEGARAVPVRLPAATVLLIQLEK